MNAKNLRIVAIIAIVAVFVTSAITMAFSPKKNLKPSEYNLGITYEKAMSEKKPFIAIFYSDWCGYCVKSMPKYETIADIYKNKYNIAMVNTDDQNAFNTVRDFAVSGLPSMYIVDPTIDNRIFIPPAIYGDLARVRAELDRYLRIRAMIK